MLVFWIAAAVLAAAAAAVIFHRAGRPGPVAEASAADLYRRHLAEQEDLHARGLLDDQEWKAARAEAGRRLLAAADGEALVAADGDPRVLRLAVVLSVAATVLAGVGVYLLTGSPGRPDQPYASRVAAWRAADPATLDAARAAAVLAELARERPGDPQVWSWLGRAHAQAGDPYGAIQALQQAVALRPGDAGDWTALGETLIALNEGKADADAVRALNRAVELDPAAPEPRYFLGRAAIAEGREQEGLTIWREAAARLPADDPRRAVLNREITRQVEGPGADEAAEAIAAAPAAEQAAAIRAMVDGLAARLEAEPDDPQGWARLVRAYTVLGDIAARDRALVRARTLFRDRPADLAAVEAAAR